MVRILMAKALLKILLNNLMEKIVLMEKMVMMENILLIYKMKKILLMSQKMNLNKYKRIVRILSIIK